MCDIKTRGTQLLLPCVKNYVENLYVLDEKKGDVMFIVHENETYFAFFLKNCTKQNVYINQQKWITGTYYIQPILCVKEWFMGDKLRYKFHMT